MASRGIDVKEHRAAHWAACAAARRPALSKDPESVALREHRAVHRWNANHEDNLKKRAGPAAVPWDKQMPLCMGDPDE